MSRSRELSSQLRIDRICDVFERQLAKGKHRQIQSYLRRVGDCDRGKLLAELRAILATNNTREAFSDAEVTQPAPAQLEQPRLPSRYRVVRHVGSGTFGSVFLAHDCEIGRSVAIKVAHGKSMDRDLRDEVRIAAQLDHPYIVPVYDVGRTTFDETYIVSKYVSGGNLSSRMKLSGFDIWQATAIVAMLAHTLRHAHCLGIVHRDIKPSNILLDEFGKPYLTDFGLALKECEYGKGRSFSGTVAYMSPEQALGHSQLADRRTDVFSLGVVFYELLTGIHPFGSSSRHDIVDRIVAERVMPPHERRACIPDSVANICLKCLEKDPQDRYATMDEVAQDLASFLIDSDPLTHQAFKRSKAVFTGLRDYLDADVVPLYFETKDHVAAIHADDYFQGHVIEDARDCEDTQNSACSSAHSRRGSGDDIAMTNMSDCCPQILVRLFTTDDRGQGSNSSHAFCIGNESSTSEAQSQVNDRYSVPCVKDAQRDNS